VTRFVKALCLTAALAALSSCHPVRGTESGKSESVGSPADARLTAMFFVQRDCPISNRYAPEIRRVCAAYAAGGVRCRLVYVDQQLTDAEARQHAREYGHGEYPVVVDRGARLVRAAGVTITPEVAVFDAKWEVAYRGRIDDSYVSWGTRRRVVGDRTLRNALDALLAGRPAPKPRTQAVGCYIAGASARPAL